MSVLGPDAREDRVNEAIADYLELVRTTDTVDAEQFIAAHADIAAELRAFLSDRQKFKDVMGPVDRVAGLPLCESPTLDTRGDAARATQPDSLGKVRYFGDYELLEEIARGGMGVVYKARQVTLNRLVALKMILTGQLASAEDVQRFHAEAEAAARLDHPGIVPIFEIGEHEGQHYFSMAFVDGESLAQRVLKGVLPPRVAAEFTKQVALAISYAHIEGVIHRDLKPANVLIDREGQARVTDFGLAKRVATEKDALSASAQHTVTGQILGTPSYMAPEQAAGNSRQIGPLADVYSLGAILYCLLTGRPPFQAAMPVDTLFQVLDQEPVSPRQLNASVPRDLETICLKCLQKEPRKRYASAQEMVDELERFLKGEPIKALPVGSAERLWRWCTRNPRVAVLSAALLLLLVATALLSSIGAVRIAAEHKTTVAALAQAEQEIYFNNVTLAHLYWQGNNVAAAEKLLDQCAPERRNWEWNYLQRHCHTELLNIPGHSGRVSAAAFTPDGAQIVSTEWISKTEHPYGKAHTWDARNGRPLLTLPGSMITADGTRMAMQRDDKSVEIWNTATGRALLTLRGHKFPLINIALSTDRKYIATVAARSMDVPAGERTLLENFQFLSETKGEVKVWNAATGEELVSREDTNGLYSVAFSPDGSRFVVPGKICETRTGKQVLTFGGEDFLVAWSPDGKRIATAGGTNQVKLWAAGTGKPLTTLRGHSDWILAIAFRSDGRRVATGSEDRTARLWDTATGEEVLSLRGHLSGVSGVGFTPDGTRLVTSGSLDRTVKVWDVTRSQEALAFLANAGNIEGLAYSPKRKWLATAEQAAGIRIRDAATGKVLARFHHFGPFAVAVSPDGERLASGGLDKNVKIWDVTAIDADPKGPARSNTRLLYTLSGHTNYVNSVAFSPDGRTIASASQDGTVKLWNVADGAQIWNAEHNDAFAYSVTFRPDGKVLAVVWGGELVLLDPSNGEKILQGYQTKEGGITTAAFSRDGKYLAFNERNVIHIWQADTGRNLHTITGPPGWIHRLVFNRDGSRLAAGGEDGAIKVWDWNTASGREVLTLRAHSGRGGVQSLDFSPDGGHLASGGGDSIIRIWEGTPPAQ